MIANFLPAHIEALREVDRGGRIYSPRLARLIIEISERWPELVTVTEDQEPDEAGATPFFQVTLTDRGRAVMNQAPEAYALVP